MQHAAAMLFVAHIDKVDDDDAAEVAQPQLACNRLRRLDVGVKNGFVEIAVADKGAGINVDSGHRLGLIDDQITA